MEITEVRIGPSDDERIAAYASITIDDCFVIHGLKLKIDRFHGTYPSNFNEGTHLISRKGPTRLQVVPFIL